VEIGTHTIEKEEERKRWEKEIEIGGGGIYL
jgi:hypothetical protein